MSWVFWLIGYLLLLALVLMFFAGVSRSERPDGYPARRGGPTPRPPRTHPSEPTSAEPAVGARNDGAVGSGQQG